jgi:Spy/CpxP family protein refolding chaperone
MSSGSLIRPFVAVALATSCVFGQAANEPPNPANMVQQRVGFLTNLLSLTAAQQQRATTIFTTAARSGMTILSNLESAHRSLENAIKNNDGIAIDQISAAIGNLTAKGTSNDAKADAAFYQILRTDQQTKLSQFETQGAGFNAGPRPGPSRHP